MALVLFTPLNIVGKLMYKRDKVAKLFANLLGLLTQVFDIGLILLDVLHERQELLPKIEGWL